MFDANEIARKAQEMKDSEVVHQIFAQLEGKYIAEWRNAAPNDLQKREAAYAAIRAIEDFKVRLGSLANAPKVEAHNTRNAARR